MPMPHAFAALPPRAEPALTPMAFVRAVVQAYEHYGADPRAALRQAQIAPSRLRDPGARVSARQFEALCRAAMQELDDEALGWFSRRLPWGSYGLLCRASLTAPDLGVALKRWCRHHRLLTEDLLLQLELRDGVATLGIEERRDFGELRELCLVTTLRYVHGYACWLIDSRIPLQGVDFPFERPAHGDVHGLLFPGPVRFGARRASMRLPAQYLELAPRRDERAMQAMLHNALSLTVLQYRRDRLLASRARACMAARPEEAHNASTLAAALNVSTRTLHRQLRDEGTSLQQLKDAVRFERAAQLLRQGRQPIKQVALSVGFASEKTFSRAFAAWAGQAPGAYRGAPRGAAARRQGPRGEADDDGLQ